MTGVLPSQRLRALVAEGAIAAPSPIEPAQVQPASLDLRLGAEAIRLRASFLPGRGRRVEERLGDFEMHRFALGPGAVLERGCVYLVPLMERLALPPGVEGVANAKSSTGRLDLLTRTICDGGAEFDRIPAGYRGPLWAEVCPRSFSVLARPGMRLSQLRLREGAARLSDDELRALLPPGAAVQDGLAFSVDLGGPGRVGWRARPHAGVIDLGRLGHYRPRDYWEEVVGGVGADGVGADGGGPVILDPGAFYILQSREAVAIPPDVAAEMAPYLAMVGEFRVHYAGFFDPGFGHGAPSRGVLEVRCHESPFALEHGQVVGRLVYERMAEVPDVLYGAGLASNYQGQGLKLSKHFREP